MAPSTSIGVDGVTSERWQALASSLSPSSSSSSTTTSLVVLVVVNGDKGGNGGCCRVPTCLASINQWEWHFGEVLGGGDGGGGGLCALRGCQQK